MTGHRGCAGGCGRVLHIRDDLGYVGTANNDGWRLTVNEHAPADAWCPECAAKRAVRDRRDVFNPATGTFAPEDGVTIQPRVGHFVYVVINGVLVGEVEVPHPGRESLPLKIDFVSHSAERGKR